jgi:DNA repair exonuclease SbcCD ATPase subunit
MSKPYKVVISLNNLEASPELREGLTCKVTADGNVSTSPVPFKDVFCFDISEKTKNISVAFQKDGKDVAKGELVVPTDIAKHIEVETTEVMKTSTNVNGNPGRELTAEFNLTFINSAAFKPKKTATQTTPKKSIGSSGLSSSKKVASPMVQSRIDTGRSKSPRNSSKDRQPITNLDNYLNKIVDKHFEEAKNRVGNDLSETSECVYLNKFNQVATSQLVNSAVLSPSKRGESFQREETDIDQTHSAERLKDKFKSSDLSRSKSPSRVGGGPDMTSILMDTETRRYVNEYKNQLEYLRNIVYSLDLKAQQLDSCQREIGSLREENEKANQAREELRKTLLETTKDLKDEGEKFSKLVIDMESQNKEILRDLRAANNKVDDLQTKLHAQEVRNAQLEAENAELRTKVKAGEAYKTQLQRLTNDYSLAEKRHADTLVHLGSRVEELDIAYAKMGGEKAKLREENSRLLNANSELKVQLTQEKANNNHLSDELDKLNNKLKLTNGAIDIVKGIQDQRDQIAKEVAKLKQTNDNLITQIENMEKEIVTKTRDGELNERSNRDELLKAQRKNTDLEAHLNDLRASHAKSRKDNIELRNHILTLEQLLCVKEDVYSQLESAQVRLEGRQGDCDKLRSQSDANSKVVEDLNDKIMELEKLVIYLKNAVTDKDDYVLNLKKLIIELKDKSAVYVAVRDDSIDRRIAEFINASNDPHRLTKLFIRERDGVYQFGTKRVYVKTEGDKVFSRIVLNPSSCRRWIFDPR